jgi:hypothetical protein
MEFLFWTYLFVYALIVLANCLYWLVLGQRLVLVLYAFAAGSYLCFLGAAYWTPLLRDCLSFYNVPLMLVILCCDFYTTMKWRTIDIKMIFPHMDDDLAKVVRRYAVIEWAKAVPIFISAPLYIIGVLLLVDFLKNRLGGQW